MRISLLAFWKYSNFLSDVSRDWQSDSEEQEPERYDFNSGQTSLHDALNVGDRLWLASYQNIDGQSIGLILGKLVITQKEFNAPGHKYGVYRVVGDPDLSMHFDPDGQDSTDALLKLEFESGRPISSPQRIGQSLQAMRRLTIADEAILECAADHLTRLA